MHHVMSDVTRASETGGTDAGRPGLLGGLLRRLVRPLWRETEALRRRTRCRLAVTLPFSTLAGVTWGAFAAPALDGLSALGWAAVGAVAFDVLVYLEVKLVPAIHRLSREVGLGGLGGIVWEGGVIGGLSFLLFDVLGAPAVPAVTLAIVLGTAYAWAMEYVVCGRAARDLVEGFTPLRSGGPAHRDEHSYAATLAVRGETDAALETYREARERDPADLVPWIRAAKLHLERAGDGDREEALRLLRGAFRHARTDAREDLYLVGRIVEVERELGDARRAAPDLARMAERHDGTEEGAWAAERLAEVKRAMREEERL